MFEIALVSGDLVCINCQHVKWVQQITDGAIVHLTHNKGESCELPTNGDYKAVVKKIKAAK